MTRGNDTSAGASGPAAFGWKTEEAVGKVRSAAPSEGLAKSAARASHLAFCKTSNGARGLYALKPRAAAIVRRRCAAPAKTFIEWREKFRQRQPHGRASV